MTQPHRCRGEDPAANKAALATFSLVAEPESGGPLLGTPTSRSWPGRPLVRGQPRTTFHVVAHAFVLHLLALDALDGKAGGPGHSADAGLLARWPISNRNSPTSSKAQRASDRQARDTTPLPRAVAVVQYDTHPARWRRFTTLTPTLSDTVSSVSTAAKVKAEPEAH